MSLNPRSLVFRYSLPFAGILLVLVIAFLAATYWQADRLLRQQLDAALQADKNGLIETYEIGGVDLVADVLRKRVSQLDGGGRFYLLTDSRFQPILGNVPTWPEDLPKSATWSELDYDLDEENDVDIRFFRTQLRDGHHLLVGYETVQIELLEEYTELNSVLSISLVLVLGLAGGLFLQLTLSRKLKRVTSSCEQIREGAFHLRIPVPEKGDEIDEMSRTLKDMLDRLQALMLDIQHITDNIAHDLRSPITRVRNQLEALSQQDPKDRSPDDLTKAIDALDELVATFNAMLGISRIETGTAQVAFTPVDLAQIVEDAVALYDPVAEEKDQEITLPQIGEMRIEGDRNLLFQTFCNVIENAIKYSPEGSAITVAYERKGAACDIIIVDQGPGIAEAEFQNITKRFYRLDKSRHHPGNGLGLAFVRAVVSLHGGTLSFANAPGLSVRLSFPPRKEALS